ncbi:hypothetical protein KSB_83450 [Ktedonobacter robiniae]|uniref:SDR family NAD(P)-dependent oxidoreductase n=1 Tax=Ktedonobacter robiniae TaxID=2778365 RepID=A0ABQ3V5I7_9CHLR|nr:hypothetical protein KSB_83450 [Ktedonobacter robiniae]
MSKTVLENPLERKAYIMTGPTSGIGRATAIELAKHGTVVLVGRDRRKLDEMQKIIERKGRHAVSVVCDLADPASVRRAASGNQVALRCWGRRLRDVQAMYPRRSDRVCPRKSTAPHQRG